MENNSHVKKSIEVQRSEVQGFVVVSCNMQSSKLKAERFKVINERYTGRCIGHSAKRGGSSQWLRRN